MTTTPGITFSGNQRKIPRSSFLAARGLVGSAAPAPTQLSPIRTSGLPLPRRGKPRTKVSVSTQAEGANSNPGCCKRLVGETIVGELIGVVIRGGCPDYPSFHYARGAAPRQPETAVGSCRMWVRSSSKSADISDPLEVLGLEKIRAVRREVSSRVSAEYFRTWGRWIVIRWIGIRLGLWSTPARNDLGIQGQGSGGRWRRNEAPVRECESGISEVT